MLRDVGTIVVFCLVIWFFFPLPFNMYVTGCYAVANILTGLGVVGVVPDFGQGETELNASESAGARDGFTFGKVIFVILIAGVIVYARIYPAQSVVSTPSSDLVETNASAASDDELPNTLTAVPLPQDTRASALAARVIARSLRVRAAPASTAPVVAGLINGQRIEINGMSADEVWLFVEYTAGQFGWTAGEYVDYDQNAIIRELNSESAAAYISQRTTGNQLYVLTTGNAGADKLYVYPQILTNVNKIAARDSSFVALTNDGNIVVWGENACGGARTPALNTVREISAGSTFCMAVTKDDTLHVWGAGGSPADSPPQSQAISAISAGYHHALVLTGNGTVLAWGDNQFGQIDVPVFAAPVVDVRAGNDASAAILQDGSAVVWGQTMGAGTYRDVADIALADNHVLILYTNGKLNVGGEVMGELTLPNQGSFVSVAADSQVHLAIRSDGFVVGSGTYTGMKTVSPTELTGVVAIATGQRQSIALHGNGSVTQFGETQDRP
jgi:hypothetical protein